MKLTNDQRDKLTTAIQAVLGVVILGLSVKESAKVQTEQMKKLAKKDAKRQNKMQNTQFKLDKKLLKEKYHTKIQKTKQAGKAKVKKARQGKWL